MAESLSSHPVDAPADADSVARKKFEVARRGFDQNEVRAYLHSVASALRAAEQREAELRDRVAAAVKRAHNAEKLDDTALTQRLGEETVRVLNTAREAAEAKIEQANGEAEEIVTVAETQAASTREEANGLLEERSAEAEVAAEAILEEARGELAKAKELREVEVEAGRVEAAELIAEAQVVREEILRDMSRRRQQAKAQVERLRAGRDRLMGTFDTVEEALDEIRAGVNNSLGEAKVAADIAARRVLEERQPDVEELEAEVDTARLLGLGPPQAPEEAPAPPVLEPAEPAEGSDEPVADGDEESAEGSDEPVEGSDEPVADGGDESAEGSDESVEGSDEPAEPAQPEEPAEVESSDDVDGLFARLRSEQTESDPESVAEPEHSSEDGPPGQTDTEADTEMVDEVRAALVATAERRLKRVLADDQNRVLAAIRPEGKAKRSGSPPKQLDLDTQVGLYVAAISAQLEARAESGSEVDEATARSVISEAFVVPLRDSVVTALGSTDDPDEKISAVRSVYRDRKGSAADIAAELIV